MLRGCLLAKYGVVRISGSSLIHNTSKWLSAVAANNPSPATTVKAEEKQGEPAWVRSALDKKIYAASDLKSLSSVIQSESFNSNAAVSTVNVLGSWVAAGKLSVSDFQKLDYRSKLEDLLLKGKFNLGVTSTIQGIKSLYALGFTPTSKVVTSLENEILWLLRKVTIRQHFQVLDFHSQSQETEMQKKILKEAVSNIQRRWVEIVEARDFASLFKYASHFSPKFIEKMEDILVELVETYNQVDRTAVFVALGACQRRSTPLLRALSYHMNKSPDPLPIRMASDILYALNRLSFHDQALIERICNDLVSQLTPEIKSPLIGSILTSLGHLKYRHEGALDALCEWVSQNWSSVRKQEVVSLLISMAMMDFLPSNWEILWLKIKKLLDEELKSPTWSASVHLDVAWSLTVLNHLEPSVAQSVLNDAFVSKVLSQSGSNEKGVKIKLNNIWAAATLNSTGTNSLTVKMPYNLIDTSAKPPALQQTVTSALAHFIPAGKYLKLNSQTPLGIGVEAECVLNDQCVPLPFAEFESGKKTLPANAHRLAILVQDYKDLCKGRLISNGVQGLRERLLVQSGYRVVKVRHNEFDPKDKLVKQLQFLEQLIKGALSTRV